MINFKSKGYYLSLSKIEFDGRVKKKIISVNALCLLKNGMYNFYLNHDYFDYIKDFSEDELNNEEKAIQGSYTEIKNNTLILKPDEVYGNPLKFEVINSNKLIDIARNVEFHFISWSKHRKLKKNGNSIIKEVLNP